MLVSTSGNRLPVSGPSMASSGLGELSCQEGKVSGWKTVVVQDGKFHAPVMGKVLGAISPVSFHKYVRKGPFARWLDHSGARSTRGDLKVTRLAKLLGVKPLCTWVPSESMQMPTGHGGKRKEQHGVTEQHGFEVLASPVWLIMYTLLVNCCNLRKKLACVIFFLCNIRVIN